MIMLAALLVGALTVPLAGGSLQRLEDPGFRTGWLLGASLAMQLAITTFWEVPPGPSIALHLGSYVLAFVWVWRNRHVPGLWWIAVGGGANGLAIFANGGVMPASPAALALSGRGGEAGEFSNSGAIEGGANLPWLGDVFAVPEAWPLSNVFSVGDVLLVIGGVVLLHASGRSRWSRIAATSDERLEPAPGSQAAPA